VVFLKYILNLKQLTIFSCEWLHKATHQIWCGTCCKLLTADWSKNVNRSYQIFNETVYSSEV